MSGFPWEDARFTEYRTSGPGASVTAGPPADERWPTRAATPSPHYLAGADGWAPHTPLTPPHTEYLDPEEEPTMKITSTAAEAAPPHIAAVALSAVLALTATACGDDGSRAATRAPRAAARARSPSGTTTAVPAPPSGTRSSRTSRRPTRTSRSSTSRSRSPTSSPSTTPPSRAAACRTSAASAPRTSPTSPPRAPWSRSATGSEKSELKGKLVENMVESVRSRGRPGRRHVHRADLREQRRALVPHRPVRGGGAGGAHHLAQFYEAADKLTDAKKNKFGYTIRGGAGSIAQALDAIYGQTGITEFWDGDKTTLNDPKNVAALEKYAALFKKTTPAADVNNDFTKMVAQWDTGTIGMLSHNLGSYQDHLKALGEDKFAGIPRRSARAARASRSPTRSTDSASSGPARTRTAAWKFIEFAASHRVTASGTSRRGNPGQHRSGQGRVDQRRPSPPNSPRRPSPTVPPRSSTCRTTCPTGTTSARRTTSRVPEAAARQGHGQGLPGQDGRRAEHRPEGVEGAGNG